MRYFCSSIPLRLYFDTNILSKPKRSVNRVEQRIQEADRLGFERIFISRYNAKGIDFKKYRIEVTQVSKLEELYNDLFV